MSHIHRYTTVTITSLDALRAAVERYCPELEFVVGQTFFRYFYGAKEGSIHVIKKKGVDSVRSESRHNGKPYEIGVMLGEVVDGVQTYVLNIDEHARAGGLLNCQGLGHKGQVVGTTENGKQVRLQKDLDLLFMHYQMALTELEAERVGDTVSHEKQQDGSYLSRIQTVARLGA